MNHPPKKLRRIVVVGMLSAVCFVLSRYLSVPAGSMKFTFSGLPIILASLLYGPVDGMLVGGIGEFLSQLFSPYGLTPTTPLWVLPAVLRGLLLGGYAALKKYRLGPVGTSAAIVVSSLAVTVANGLVIWADAVLMGYFSKAYVFGATGWRFLSSVITAVLYCLIVIPLLRALRRGGFGKSAAVPEE